MRSFHEPSLRWPVPAFPASSYERCSSPLPPLGAFAGLGPVCPTYLPCTGKHRTAPSTSDVTITRADRGRITSLSLYSLFLTHPRILLATFAAKAHCWLMANLFSTRIPGFLLQGCFPAGCSSASTGLLIPTCRTLHCPFLNLLRLLLPHFFQTKSQVIVFFDAIIELHFIVYGEGSKGYFSLSLVPYIKH